MKKYNLIATTTFGLEAVVKRELQALGYENLKTFDGRIEFQGTKEDIARTNLWLRCAERVLIKFGEFPATTFEELFQGTKALPWEELITRDGKFVVNGRSHQSKLFSISDSQAIVKKAIVERLKKTYALDWFSEKGETYSLEVILFKDVATLTVDTSGEGLHKRGYRDRAGDAPIKETLASAMIQLSYWNPKRTLYDPFCGSGTILIEAAMIAKNIAPGLDRDFDAVYWPAVGPEVFREQRRHAMALIDNSQTLSLLGSDTDKRSILRARDNAGNVGVDQDIQFFVKDMREVNLHNDYGVVITNPPYGERMGEQEEIKALYEDFGEKMYPLDTWSTYVITKDEDFEKLFKRKADRKRKLYNGRIKVDYYQFYGPRPGEPPKKENPHRKKEGSR